ncbi:hypothetical protein GCM10010271_36740 [Streptomyces kurssanovii]|nr:hypothetical protein GCM10010271_36740 [Streptomyces kurssanovii]
MRTPWETPRAHRAVRGGPEGQLQDPGPHCHQRFLPLVEAEGWSCAGPVTGPAAVAKLSQSLPLPADGVVFWI